MLVRQLCIPLRDSRPWFVAVLLVAAFAIVPPQAHASQMTWPLRRAIEVRLAFGGSYASGSGQATHRGADVAAEEGESVFAPTPSTVSFVGTVPGVGGGTVTAVTLATGDGASVTLLPLSGVSVSRGQSLDAGDEVATVAAAGDASSPGTHLHVGVKRGDIYLDPATLFSVAAPLPPSEPRVEQTVEARASEAQASIAPAAGVTAEVKGTVPSSGPGGAAQAPAPAAQPVGEPNASTGPVGQSAVSGTAAATRGSPADAPVPEHSAANASAGPASLSQTAASASLLAEQSPSSRRATKTANTHTTSRQRPGGLARAATTLDRLVHRTTTVWQTALLATLVGLGALWPVMRRREQLKEQPEVGAAPGGSDVAAVAGRC